LGKNEKDWISLKRKHAADALERYITRRVIPVS